MEQERSLQNAFDSKKEESNEGKKTKFVYQ